MVAVPPNLTWGRREGLRGDAAPRLDQQILRFALSFRKILDRLMGRRPGGRVRQQNADWRRTISVLADERECRRIWRIASGRINRQNGAHKRQRNDCTQLHN